jgi:hypothetical protein
VRASRDGGTDEVGLARRAHRAATVAADTGTPHAHPIALSRAAFSATMATDVAGTGMAPVAMAARVKLTR